MSDEILCERDQDITRITLNRPDDGNRISNEMGGRLVEMFAEAEKHSKLILLRGAGADFCLGRVPPTPPPGAPPGTRPSALQSRAFISEPPLRLYAAFRQTRIPIVGAVQGGAESVGCSAAALCDVTVAGDDAHFRLPEMIHNIPPTLAMSALIDRISRKTISYMVLTSDELDAETAMRLGIVNKVVPAGELDAEVERIIAILSSRAAASLRAVKEYLRSAPDMDPQASYDFASNLITNVMSSLEERR